MGQALEAAREAEAALLALQRQPRKNSGDASASAPTDDSADREDPSALDAESGDGPIHHVEIEATELIPNYSGRATRGFVARVHRGPASEAASAPETHIFSDHGDLVNFLRDALAKDSPQR
jgi:hypothetical protein